jgi:hypothetical protein
MRSNFPPALGAATLFVSTALFAQTKEGTFAWQQARAIVDRDRLW